jgi:hypothetical protein
MIHLHEKDTNIPLGTITEGQLQFLIDQLEEEWESDQDYSITPLLIQAFEAANADPELISLLKDALGERDEVIIVWSR